MSTKKDKAGTSRHTRWLPWVVGVAMLATVITVALHFSEGKELLDLTRRARPAWLLVALALQACTYFYQGEVFRRVGLAAGHKAPIGLVYRLGLAKLFMDQALPSAGVSGTLLFAKSLEESGMPRGVVRAGVVIDLVSYYAAYVLCLVAALVVASIHHHTNWIVVLIAAGFGTFCIAMAATLLTIARRGTKWMSPRLLHFKPLASLVAMPAGADVGLTRRPWLLGNALVLQLGIMLFDCATMWVLIRSLGADASPDTVFASFMISNLLRTIGVVPGGLGTFEAASVFTLKLAGVSVPAALAATLLFRGFSFWLPMLPGLWFSRRASRRAGQVKHGTKRAATRAKRSAVHHERAEKG